MNQRSMERLKRQVANMPEDIIKGYLKNAEVYEQMGFVFWTEVIEILWCELDRRQKENRD